VAAGRQDGLTTDALGLAAQVRAGDVSAAELTDDAIRKIEATNPQFNFLVTDSFEQARATTPANGPFAGVPMLVKDLNETAGIRTTFSSRAFANYVPETDSGVVRRIKDAGFVILGKSNTPEFGITAVTESDLNGACRNPWDPERTPGGSSGGSAAAAVIAVAAALLEKAARLSVAQWASAEVTLEQAHSLRTARRGARGR